MKVLIVKTSSMGDVIHTLPAVSDALRAYPDSKMDWLVEESLAEIPAWHRGIGRVIPVALRRWRRHPWTTGTRGEWSQFRDSLKQVRYDKIIDAQGLLKSAWLAWMARGPRYGYDKNSIKEPLASWSYQHRCSVPKGGHAIQRVRQLFALALDYPLPNGAPDYGIELHPSHDTADSDRSVVFLHGSAQRIKQWPLEFWIELSRLANENGFKVNLPWGTVEEKIRAEQIASGADRAQVLPKKSLGELAQILSASQGIIGVDSGLSHLTAALKIPSVTLFSASSPYLTGAVGPVQDNLWSRAAQEVASGNSPFLKIESISPPLFTAALAWNKLQEMRGRI